ncbi:MAG: MBL fold metallo-hydrolase [Candidatus Pacebacteria bacterium]|nr:MBL fold metallo-hydrolase [Candidatus Paceibacterota bacterium]MBP9700885.1 MBL fold metallo-hydrolase [Candidatus Paceibacterota bacterium]
MVITYYGRSYFKLTLGDLTIATNPPSKSLKPSRFGADIALITANVEAGNDPETVSMGDREPFVLNSPGSYEVRELFFAGAPSNVTIDKVDRINTVYGFELDGIKIAFLGAAYDEKSLSTEAKEIASQADMIFISIGEDASLAYKTATSFDPNVIIPMDYTEESLKRFLKEGGQEKTEIQDKATLKRRDLDGKEGHIIVLAAQ